MLLGLHFKNSQSQRHLRILRLCLQARAMSQNRRSPKQFAPLDPQKSNERGAPPLKGIVFDVDGTLWYVLIPSLLWLLAVQLQIEDLC